MAENKNIEVGGRLHSIATGNVLAGANEIFDDEKNKKQNDINTETYTLVNNINERLDSLSPDQQSALSVATKATNNETKLGYYVCGTEGNVVAKVISDATGYILSTGGSIKVKMTNANTTDNVTLNINSTGAKPLYYDGKRASANNSWEEGETVEVYYDGTSYYANNVAGGSGSGDGVFDVSVKYPTSGVDGGNTYTLSGALAVLNTNLSSNKKKGGMSIKFIQSSDNKYVQYVCILSQYENTIEGNKAFSNVDNWEITVFEKKFENEIFNENIYYRSKIEEGVDGVNFYSGAYINTKTSNLPQPIEFSSVSCMIIACKAGDTFQIFAQGIGSVAVQIWSFWRNDYSFIERSNLSVNTTFRNKGLLVTAPQDAAYIAINMYQPTDTDAVFKIEKIEKKSMKDVIDKDIPTIKTQLSVIDAIDKDIPTIKTQLSVIDRAWSGKTIVCFGDSITEYTDANGKSYTDYLQEISKANVINVGVGGTMIRSRSNPTLSVNEQTDETQKLQVAYSKFDIYNLITTATSDAVTRFDELEDARDYLITKGDDNSAMVSRFEAIDWSKVDAITIFAGTNDFNNAHSMGTTETTNWYTMLGAINYIIGTFCAKYRSIPIFWFTPIVRWVSPYADADWCDVREVKEQGTMKKLSDYATAIIEECKKAHIPVCDMYFGLGWNKFNFWEYFYNTSEGDSRTDGTHPYKGFDFIAHKIYGFLVSNNTF